MKKYLTILLAIIFLSVQMGSTQHMAEHGFKHHEHGGKLCQIEAYFQSSQGFDTASAELTIPAGLYTEVSISDCWYDSLCVQDISNNQSPRAPPYIS